MKYAVIAVRVIMGLIFFAGAASYFAGMAPKELPPGDLGVVMTGFAAWKYFMPLLKGTELVCGLLLLSGFYVPLALVVLAPIVINIFLTHAFLAPEPPGMIVAVLLVVFEIFLAWVYRANFKGVLAKK